MLLHLSRALLMLSFSVLAHAAEFVELQTRPDVEQRFILIKPAQPVASVILFAGGHGALELSSLFGSPTIGWGKNNFLVRSRDRFADRGLMVAVVDAPSDRQGKKGMLDGFRDSAEHVIDIDQVIAYLRGQAAVPVWLVGTSRGTESAAQLAIRSQQRPHGLVLTSSMSEPNGKGTAVTEMALDRVTLPTLLLAHAEDGCSKTPPSGARRIAAQLTRAPAVDVQLFRGGDRPRSKPCRALSQHGFLGIEDEVVDSIAAFIRAN